MATTVTITQLYQLLSEKTDKATAEALTSYVEQKVTEEVQEKSKALATKEDINTLKEDISTLKVDLLKWIISLFIAQMTAMIGLLIGLYFK